MEREIGEIRSDIRGIALGVARIEANFHEHTQDDARRLGNLEASTNKGRGVMAAMGVLVSLIGLDKLAAYLGWGAQ